MLAKLVVQNYALIRDLDLDFEDGLTIITGETGAGKSILLGALSLILGARADSGVLLDKGEKCIVEGTFKIADYELDDFFAANELDFEPVTTLRREINPAGKSRAFINDTPVTINLLRDLGDHLIDIHSQHQTLMLGDNSFQMNIIDSFAGTAVPVQEYRSAYHQWMSLKKEYSGLKEKADRNKADLEYYQFQYKQLDEAKLISGEQSELEREQEILEHAGEIKGALGDSAQLFTRDEDSVLGLLREIRTNLSKIKIYIPEGEELVRRADSSLIELDDLSRDIARLAAFVEADPDRLSVISTRLDTIWSLIRKHRVADLEELLLKKEEIEALVRSIEGSDERVTELEKLISDREKELLKTAAKISVRRKEVLDTIENEITELLKQLGMPNAKFRVSLVTSEELTPTGLDRADFLFSSNRQIPPENLARIASGGELSRVMLSLKSLLSRNTDLPTIIFDEIDSGVSGEVADKVGQILSGMGKFMQVINITHLPQVASRGTRHYHVYKDDTDDSTITRVKLLSSDERILEVARLLSGSEITETAIRNARELLDAAIN
jgi:DNA repair protein RecN (Recombination protein N)